MAEALALAWTRDEADCDPVSHQRRTDRQGLRTDLS